MKKVTILIMLALCFENYNMKAQNFPDGSFENNWEYFSNPTPGKSDYWDFKDAYFLATLNQLHELSGVMGDAPLTAFRESNAIDGNYALKLISNTMTFGEDLFLPGAAGTLYIDFTNLDCILGKPFTYSPLQSTGWFQSTLVNGDSAAIEVFLKKGGAKIGGGKMLIYNNVNTWTSFNIPITYTSQQTPDSVVVIFASSAGYDFTSIETLMQCKGQNGSILMIDDVAFGYEQGIKQLLFSEKEIFIFPNPVADKLNIQLNELQDGKLVIYDNSGREVESKLVNSDNVSINVSDLAKGSYFINLYVNGKQIASKQFVKE